MKEHTPRRGRRHWLAFLAAMLCGCASQLRHDPVAVERMLFASGTARYLNVSIQDSAKGEWCVRLSTEMGNTHDLDALRDTPVRTLVLIGGTVSNISALANCPIQELEMVGCRIEDLSGLERLELNRLLFYAMQVSPSDLDVVRGLPLEELAFGFVALKDTSFLSGMRLKSLYLPTTNVVNAPDVLRGLPTLKRINGLSTTEFWQRYDAGTL